MKYFISLYLVVLFAGSIFGFSQDYSKEISAGELKRHVEFLASDTLKGRMTGTPEADIAAGYIKDQFVRYGLKPGKSDSFYQDFSFIADIALTGNNSISIAADAGSVSLMPKKDFIPLSFSGSGKISAPAVFAGYGISAPKLKYDDYSGLDVKDKIVVVFRSNPEYNDPHTAFEEYSSMRFKANLAKEKGAAGVIFINGPVPKTDDDKLVDLKYDRAPGLKNFLAVQVKREFVESFFRIKYPSLTEIQDSINRSKKPLSFVLAGVTVSAEISLSPIEKTGRNVIGIVEGTDPALKDEYIVIGAHYDHLGMGSDGSLYRGKEALAHNGADDNASGTAAVLELAQKIAAENNLRRTVLFAAFTGEELGLLGSNYLVNNLPLPQDKMSAMFNFDMVGRLNNEKNLILYGTGTSTIWKPLVDSLNRPYSFKLTKNDEGYGPSDHASFYAKNIPVLFFFTGTHSDYHRPTDDADKLNYIGEELVIKFAHEITLAAANREKRPDYINVPRKQGENAGGWKVYVGTIPDYAYQGEGLKITGVSEGGPAQKAGLQGGDILIRFGETKIANIYDYVYALKNHVPGDIVEVDFIRAEKKMNTTVELGAK